MVALEISRATLKRDTIRLARLKKRKKAAQQNEMVFDEGKDLSTAAQQYDPTSIINQVRQNVDTWRALPNPSQWQVTPETARLLQHWRHHKFSGVRPFFCQVEAAETAIWLTEVAPQTKSGKLLLLHLASANKDANPELMRLALKLATGAGKTTVMAMLIAWQTINAVRRPSSKNFTRGFLVCAPGLTIKDRLRVLQPNDPNSYYKDRELLPGDMLDDMGKAKIVITNYHAFKMRERIELSKGEAVLSRSYLAGISLTGCEKNQSGKLQTRKSLRSSERLGPIDFKGTSWPDRQHRSNHIPGVRKMVCPQHLGPFCWPQQNGHAMNIDRRTHSQVQTDTSIVVTLSRQMVPGDLVDDRFADARKTMGCNFNERHQFPDDFMFQLTTEEWAGMRSQIVTTSSAKGSTSSQTAINSPPVSTLTSQFVISVMTKPPIGFL